MLSYPIQSTGPNPLTNKRSQRLSHTERLLGGLDAVLGYQREVAQSESILIIPIRGCVYHMARQRWGE